MEYENEEVFKVNSHNKNPHTQKDTILPNGRTNKKTTENSGEILVGQRIEVFFSEVTVVGLKYVVLTGGMYVRKAIWLFFVLGGFGFMIYQFYDRISYYISDPTTVSVQVTKMKEIEFPTVTICNENIVSKSLADHLPGFTDLITQIYPPWPTNDFEPTFDAVQTLEDAFNSTDWGTLWLRGSPFYNRDLWQHCTFKRQVCNLTHIKLVPTEVGYCLQFNGESVNYTVSQPGFYQGLWMMVNISQNDYLYATSRMAGVRVTVHEKHESPSIAQYSIKATPGSITAIALKKKIVTDLPKPYTNCSDEEDYSSHQCLKNCIEEYIIENCNCQVYYFSDRGFKICNPEEVYSCADVYMVQFLRDGLVDVLCSCPVQCQTTNYIYTTSSAATSEFAMESIANLACGENCTEEEIQAQMSDIRKDVVEFEVYFQDLQVEEVVMQEAYPTLALLCDIGGALGLILGATVLTVFEVIDFLLVLLYDWVRYKFAMYKSRKLGVQDDPRYKV